MFKNFNWTFSTLECSRIFSPPQNVLEDGDDAKTRVSSARSSVTQHPFPSFPVLPPIGSETDAEKGKDFAKLEKAAEKAKQVQDGESP